MDTTLQHYQKKLSKVLKKRSRSTDPEAIKELDRKKKKYEDKISEIQPNVAVNGNSTDNTQVSLEEKQPDKPTGSIDKSGVTLLLFYAYVEPVWKPAQHTRMIEWAQQTLEANGVTGRLRVSREGFNGTLTGPYDGIRAFTSALRTHSSGHFTDMQDGEDFKYTDNLPEGQAFPKLKVFPVKELVNYGLGVENPPSVKNGAVHLSAKEYHEKLKEDNTVVIDVRNTYEAEIGRFTPREGGAVYVDPKMRVSTEFPKWAKEHFDDIKDKQVLMYCTGGIRCERASALIRSLGHNNVYQLKGGIHKYLEAFPAGSDSQWSGKNYTFDKRFAHGAAGGESSVHDGPSAESEPVVDEEETTRSRQSSSDPAVEVLGRCAGCSVPWEKYRGKRRCPVCGVPLLLCTQCAASGEHSNIKCSLCKEDEKLGRRPFNKKEHYKEVEEVYPELITSITGNKPQDAAGVSTKKRKSDAVCGVCAESFPSRNALFKHLKESGHQNRKAKKK